MISYSRPKSPSLLAAGGATLAAAAVALLSLFPGTIFAGIILAILAGLLFGVSRLVAEPGRRREIWVHTLLDWPILLLIVQMCVSYWASALHATTWVTLGQIAAGLVAYYAIVNWSHDRARLWWAVAALIALGLALALIAPFAVNWLRDRTMFLPSTLYEFFPLLLSDSIHHNVMASSLVTLLPLPLALYLAQPAPLRRRFWPWIVLLTISVFEIAIVILTQSRGGYIALGVSLWLTLWLSGRRRWAIILTVVAALAVAWLITRPPTVAVEALDPTQAALDPSTWEFRQQVWQVAIQLISDFPFTGLGAGTFNDAAALFHGFSSGDNPGAHNLFLQAGVDLGLLGLVSFLAILLLVLWAALQTYRMFDSPQDRHLRGITIGGLSGIVATITHGLVDSHTWGSKGTFIPWTVMGLLVVLYSLALVQSLGLVDGQEPVSS
jgi:putative inorganic carbon (HCO3(-)) transporter